MPVAYMLTWEESEAGWGVRPDGLSLHLSQQHVKEYLAELTRSRQGTSTPHEYDRPCGDAVAVEVTDDVYEDLVRKGGHLRAYTDLVLRVSATGARRVARKGYEGTTFMGLVLAKKAKLSEVDDYVARWHEGQGQGAELHEYLGLTTAEYSRFMHSPAVLTEIALQRALASLKPVLARHIKSAGDYLVLGAAKLEANLADVTVYLGVDGQLWVRDQAEFNDGRFLMDDKTGNGQLSLTF